MTQDLDLIFALYRLGRHFKSISKVHNQDYLLSLYILKNLEKSAKTNTELAELSAMKPSAMSEIVDTLVKNGFVARLKHQDARKLLVTITTVGKKHLKDMTHCVHTHSQPYLQSLTISELDTLVTLLKKIII